MRRTRFTYKNALHHVYNRGIKRMPIFLNDDMKIFFIKLLYEKSRQYGIEIFSYCVMTNHYHITLKNSSLRMSDMMRDINSIFAMTYNSLNDRKGYVLDNRFYSIPIEDIIHLMTVIAYNLMNPVRALITDNVFNYAWSSVHEIFSNACDKSHFITSYDYVESIFGNESNFIKCLNEMGYRDPQISKDRNMSVIGSKEYLEKVLKKMDRRISVNSEPIKMKRVSDVNNRRSCDQIILEVEHKFQIKLNKLDYRQHKAKKIRYLLLIALREEACLSYSEIQKISPFNKVKNNSLSRLYCYAIKLMSEGKLDDI